MGSTADRAPSFFSEKGTEHHVGPQEASQAGLYLESPSDPLKMGH